MDAILSKTTKANGVPKVLDQGAIMVRIYATSMDVEDDGSEEDALLVAAIYVANLSYVHGAPTK